MRSLLRFALVGAFLLFAGSVGVAGSQMPSVGSRAPAFSYRQLDGKMLRPGALRGHPYVLWLVASWCSSCQTGSEVVGEHIAMLKRRGVNVVELRLAKDLGAPGPGLQAFARAVGPRASSANWYWGEATQMQTVTLDPKGYPDLYYLINARGKIVAIAGNPAVSWDTIQQFAETVRQQ